MSVSIRLRREGAKNRPYYKVVVADSRSPRDGKFIEIIGTYDPKKEGENSAIKIDRAEHWIARGAQPSDTVRSLLKKNRSRSEAASDEAAPAEAGAEKAPARGKPAEKSPAATKPDGRTAPRAAEQAASAEATAAPARSGADEAGSAEQSSRGRADSAARERIRAPLRSPELNSGRRTASPIIRGQRPRPQLDKTHRPVRSKACDNFSNSSFASSSRLPTKSFFRKSRMAA